MGQLADHLVVLPLKKRVLSHLNGDIQVAGNTAGRSGFSFSTQLEPRTGVHSTRNFNLEVRRFPYRAGALTLCTRVGHHGPLPTALAACSGHRKKALLKPHLATATTGAARLWPRSWFRPSSLTGRTRRPARNGNGFFRPEGGLLKGDLKAVTEIAPTRLTSSSASATEEIAKDVTKDVFKVRCRVESSARSARPLLKCSVPKAIILSAFLRVAEDLIGLRQVFEFLFGRLVSGITVWVVAERRFAIGLFQFFCACVAAHAQ